MELFVVKDEKAGVFMTPFFVAGIVQACRMVAQAATNPDTVLAKYPSDFSLWRLASFNQHTAQLEDQNLVHVVNVIDLAAEIKGVSNGKS